VEKREGSWVVGKEGRVKGGGKRGKGEGWKRGRVKGGGKRGKG
jgi:hypothetical protein